MKEDIIRGEGFNTPPNLWFALAAVKKVLIPESNNLDSNVPYLL